MTPALLLRIMPQAGRNADVFAVPLADAMERYNIVGIARQAAFLSQVGIESDHLRHLMENLSYSGERMMQVWPARFPTLTSTIGYVRNPQALANKVYANRMGNGDEKSGDGWKYRGRGIGHITGKANYEKCGQALGFDLVGNPGLLESPRLAAESFAWFWSANGINRLADAGDITAVSKRVNGGVNGLAQRIAMYELARKVLA